MTKEEIRLKRILKILENTVDLIHQLSKEIKAEQKEALLSRPPSEPYKINISEESKAWTQENQKTDLKK